MCMPNRIKVAKPQSRTDLQNMKHAFFTGIILCTVYTKVKTKYNIGLMPNTLKETQTKK